MSKKIKDTEYLYLSTKIRAMESRLLDRERMDRMLEAATVEDAAKVLWKAGIYAESGMGCTGPLVMMSEANHAKALELLKAAGYVG